MRAVEIYNAVKSSRLYETLYKGMCFLIAKLLPCVQCSFFSSYIFTWFTKPSRCSTPKYSLETYFGIVFGVRSPGGWGGGVLEYKKGGSSRILKLTPKGDQSGRGSRVF